LAYIIDHWSGQIDPKLYDEFEKKNSPKFDLILVPEITTAHCQPLDCYFNRELKYIARKIYSYAIVHGDEFGEPIKLVDRNSILKTQSLLHFLLSAPIFKPMIIHSWFCAGLTTNNPAVLNAYSACFKLIMTGCTICNCQTAPFICCSWCRKEICFTHFYHDYHMMNCESGPYYNRLS